MKSEFDAEGIGLAAISVDTAEESMEFATEKRITVPLLSDPEGEVIDLYGVRMKDEDIAVPTTVIIDKDKVVRWKYIGETMMDRPDGRGLLAKAEELKRQ